MPVALPDAVKYERIIELITFCSRHSLCFAYKHDAHYTYIGPEEPKHEGRSGQYGFDSLFRRPSWGPCTSSLSETSSDKNTKTTTRRIQDLQRGAIHRKRVLDDEQPPRRGDIGERAENERQHRKREADDGEVLEVPAVGVVSV